MQSAPSGFPADVITYTAPSLRISSPDVVKADGDTLVDLNPSFILNIP